jgi:galactoside O-acetyltransferase
MAFYSQNELQKIGFKAFGKNVLISNKASIYKPETISLGDNVRIDDFSVLVGGVGIEIGNYVHIACFCALYGGSGIIMEDFSGLSSRVTIYSESDDYSGSSLTNPTIPLLYKPKYQKGKVILKKHTIVGVNSTILPGVLVEEGAAIGAYCFVTKSCEPWSIYFGIPAKKLKNRNIKLLELEANFLSNK